MLLDDAFVAWLGTTSIEVAWADLTVTDLQRFQICHDDGWGRPYLEAQTLFVNLAVVLFVFNRQNLKETWERQMGLKSEHKTCDNFFKWGNRTGGEPNVTVPTLVQEEKLWAAKAPE